MANDETPEKWWTTPYGRSLSDFGYISEREPDFFRNLQTVEGLALERQRLGKRTDLLLLLSLLGAAVMLAGGLPENSQFSFMGIEGPSTLVSLQILGVGVAGVFARYWQLIISLTLLSQMIDKILAPLVGNAHVDFVVARHDSSYLWTNLMRNRDVGYQSPLAHKLTAVTIPIFGLLLMSLQSSVVLGALWYSMSSAAQATPLSIPVLALAVASFSVALLSVFLFLMGFLIPLPFRMSADMKAFLDSEERAKTEISDAASGKSLSELGNDEIKKSH